MDEPRWLDDDEQQVWRRLIGVVLTLPAALEQQLQRDAGISHFEYWVMALLSEAPERRMKLSQLAATANASLSRLSHVITRLQRRGWVSREPCPEDARATYAVLTDAGWDKVVATAPGHVERVRSIVFDGLDRATAAELARACDAILGHMQTAGRTGAGNATGSLAS